MHHREQKLETDIYFQDNQDAIPKAPPIEARNREQLYIENEKGRAEDDASMYMHEEKPKRRMKRKGGIVSLSIVTVVRVGQYQQYGQES